MRCQTCPQRRVFRELHAEFQTCLLHQLRDGRVIDVANPGEQVVFDLKVQAAEEPSHHLMDRPGVFDAPGVGPEQRELRLLHAVCQLKDDAEHHPEHERRHPVEQQRDPGGVEQQRNPECQGEKDRFSAEEDGQFPPSGTRESMAPDPSGDEFSEITPQVPLDRKQPV